MISRRSLLAFVPASVLLPRTATAKPSAAERLVAAAESQIGQTVSYDPAYTRLAYPGGDVEIEKGVCTDVVIRAYRKGLGIDLQQLVHDDMVQAFSAYPRNWGLKQPDANIDHRRVPNLQVFFKRKSAGLPVTDRAGDYHAGDVVSMMLPGNLPHIGIVSTHRSADGTKPLLVHNIGEGTQLEDVLFVYKLTGHYRYKVEL